LLHCVRAKNHFSRSAAQCAALLEKWFFALTGYIRGEINGYLKQKSQIFISENLAFKE